MPEIPNPPALTPGKPPDWGAWVRWLLTLATIAATWYFNQTHTTQVVNALKHEVSK